MNRAYVDMLHCLNTGPNGTSIKGMEMSVLEQQKMVFKRQQEQLLKVQQQHELSCYNDLNMLSFLPAQVQDFQMLDGGPRINGIMDRPIKADPSTENRWVDFGMQQSGVSAEHSGVESAGQVNSPCYGMDYVISRTTSLSPIMVATATAIKTGHSGIEGTENLIPSEQRAGGEPVGVSSKKRKAEKNMMTPKIREEAEGNRLKRSKGCPDEEESKITEQNSNRNSSQSKQKEISCNNSDRKNKENTRCTSKDNSNGSQVQKTDYIHVRARRGQATDSHSLAERVRREKISERMRYLQDLVPGCDKITGKAGMLDEIINYVQSLQRQVEFLSMKLATVTPSLDFNIDDLIAKEVLAACSSSLSLPVQGVSPDLANLNYLQYNPLQQMDPVCGSQIVANSIDTGLQRNINVPVSMPETFLDSSCFNVNHLPYVFTTAFGYYLADITRFGIDSTSQILYNGTLICKTSTTRSFNKEEQHHFHFKHSQVSLTSVG